MVVSAHQVLRCAAHIKRSKQPLKGEPQGCHRNEQAIRLLTVSHNVTLNAIAESDTDREERRREEIS